MSRHEPDIDFKTLKFSLRLLRHRLMGRIFEIALTPLDILVQSEIQMMSEPPRADLLLLRRKGKAWTEEQRRLLPDGIRDRNCRHHLLECKFSESVNEWAIQQALGYDNFYCRAQGLKQDQLQTYVISAKTPNAEFLQRLGYQNSEANGVYTTNLPILSRIVLLVLNELDNQPHNDFLRLFASRQSVRRQSMDDVTQSNFAEWSDEFWSMIFGLQKVYDLEEDAMTKELTVDDVIEIGKKIRKRVIANASPEERLAGLAPEDRLAGLAPEDRLAGLAPEDRLAGLAPEEMEALLKQIESLLQQQPANRKPRKHRRLPKSKH